MAEATFTLRAVDATRQAFASVQNSMQKITTTAGKLTSALGIGLSIAGITAMGRSVLDLGGRLNDLSIEAGMATDTFQTLAYANLQNGLQFEQTAKAAENLRSKIQDAVSGNEAAIKSFQSLSLSAEGLRTLSIAQQFEVIAIRLKTAADQQAAFNAISEIFGAKIGPKMKETLDQIATSGFDEISKGFDSIKLSDEEIKNIDRAGDSFQFMFAKIKAGAASAFVTASNFFERLLEQKNRALVGGGMFIGPLPKPNVPINPDEVKTVSPEIEAAMKAAREDADAAKFAIEHAKTANVSEDRTSRMMKAANDLQQIRNSNLDRYEQQLVAIRSPLDVYMAEIERITELETSQGLSVENAAVAVGIAAEAYAAAVGPIEDMASRLSLANSEANKTIPAMSQLAQISNDAGSMIAQGFEDAILSGQKLGEVVRSLGRDLLRLVFQKTITNPLAEGIGGVIKAAFGARAMGGPVSSGSPYVVGEKGPELFVPHASGTIVPNNKMGSSGGGGSGGVTVNYNIAAGVSRAELVPILDQERRRLKAEIPDMVRRGGGYRAAFA